MRVALDISPIENEHEFRGIGTYSRNIYKALQQYKSNIEIYIFTRKQKLPNNIDLIHSTYFDPFLLTLPLYTIPFAVTVHDLIPLWYPKYFPKGIRGEIYWRIQKHMLQRASAIITDSQYSKSKIHQTIQYPPEKIYTIPLAPSDGFNKNPSDSLCLDVRTQYKLPAKYFLYVGDVNWNKNILGLIKAFHIVRKNINDSHLVLVGRAFLDDSLKEVKEINALIHTLNLEASIVRTGYITEKHLTVLYALAQAYVQPSFAEGFGLPVLEAMAEGCIGVVSRDTSLPEIAGPSVLVDPYNPDSIADGMYRVLQLDTVKAKQAAKHWAGQFTWKKTAQKTIAVYQSIMHRSNQT